MSNIDFETFVKKYYILRNGFYYPKISVGKPSKLTREQVKEEYLVQKRLN